MIESSLSGGFEQPQILIVDDEPAIRSLFAGVVKREGYCPVLASNGREASIQLELCGDSLALVVLDLIMPHGSGFAFRAMQLAEQRFSTIPTIVVTGDQTTGAERTLMRPQAWLRKPLSLEELRDAISTHARKTGFMPLPPGRIIHTATPLSH